ncbi:MAG: class II glutamine amidotransferase [Opitutaceae bacterium]|nr:class II glutamine amidotransferase [Cytophagales bacterium]
MSEPIKHECGIALVRLLRPYSYYIKKYGTPFYGLNKLYILMEKQTNRGQDGAGVAVVKIGVPPGSRYISRYRSMEHNPVGDIFEKINKKVKKHLKGHKDKLDNADWLKENVAFMGEVMIGHLRYGTHGMNSIENCHPFLRQNNWRSRNLVLAGNFNMTNVDQLFQKLIELGQHPKEMADTVTVLEKIGHFLDEEIQMTFNRLKDRYTNLEISEIIENSLDLPRVLKRSVKDFDGGYAMVGMTGYGASFVARDPNGIRPAYYYADDEVVVVASERPAIRQAFKCAYEDIKEVQPGHALIINKDGDYNEYNLRDAGDKKSCSFERIYFSRGSDPAIYKERKMLGKSLTEKVLKAVDHDIENTVFSYIPNTAETAFMGFIEGVNDHIFNKRMQLFNDKKTSKEDLEKSMRLFPRLEKLIIKDAKIRTFITDDNHRNEMVSSSYDSTFETVRAGIDSVVVIDDSIVRGTTLEKSILRILDKHKPKKIVIVSSAPQIRYPDCYGIDMSKIGEFVSFRALLALLKDDNLEHRLDETYEKCKFALENNEDDIFINNYLQELYNLYTDDQVSAKIAKIITPKDLNAEVVVVYQSIAGLHKACPNHIGDWYFSGNYPTPGGTRTVNKAFVNFMEGKLVRAY